jgi:predicted metal-dependent hydrolase
MEDASSAGRALPHRASDDGARIAGDFAELSLADMLQTFLLQRRSGVVTLQRQGESDATERARIQIRDGEAIVRAPVGISVRRLNAELQRSEKWVEEKLAIIRSQPVGVERKFVSGETLPFLGRKMVLDVYSAPRSKILASGDVLTVRVSNRVKKREEYIRKGIIGWLGEQGRIHLEQRANYFAGQLDVKWRELKIKSFRTLWGSCSHKGDLAFSWRIMMAPASVADYVVAHELAHRIEFNHSAKFWHIVQSVMPDYRDRRDWLHHNSSLLNV